MYSINTNKIFEEELSIHIPYLTKKALILTGDYDEANDLVQETMMKAWKNVSSYTEGTNGRAWLIRIMKNTFINLKRKKSNVVEFTSDDWDFLDSVNSEYSKPKSSNMEDDLYRAMKRINKKQRLIIYLRYYMKLKYDEISTVLKIPEGSVKTGLFKAKQKLKLSMEGYAAC